MLVAGEKDSVLLPITQNGNFPIFRISRKTLLGIEVVMLARNLLVGTVFFVCCLATTFLTGCGGGKFPVRPASGTVVCDGQPVSNGSVTFTPIGEGQGLETGKPASAALATDGTFKLSTFDRFDGAIIGKHRVVYTGSEGEEEDDAGGEDEEQSSRAKPSPAKSTQGCVLQGELIVEVQASGDNVFKIELTKRR